MRPIIRANNVLSQHFLAMCTFVTTLLHKSSSHASRCSGSENKIRNRRAFQEARAGNGCKLQFIATSLCLLIPLFT